MTQIDTKEIAFDEYCKKCKFKDLSESEDPCWDCLENPMGYNTRKPIKFKPAD